MTTLAVMEKIEHSIRIDEVSILSEFEQIDNEDV